MQVGQFPASAATALIEGYCDDFVSLAAVLAQTLEQLSIRSINLDHSRAKLERIERGMREMAAAIQELLERGKVTTEFELALNRPKTKPPAAAAPPPPTPPPPPMPMHAPAPPPTPTAEAHKLTARLPTTPSRMTCKPPPPTATPNRPMTPLGNPPNALKPPSAPSHPTPGHPPGHSAPGHPPAPPAPKPPERSPAIPPGSLHNMFGSHGPTPPPAAPKPPERAPAQPPPALHNMFDSHGPTPPPAAPKPPERAPAQPPPALHNMFDSHGPTPPPAAPKPPERAPAQPPQPTSAPKAEPADRARAPIQLPATVRATFELLERERRGGTLTVRAGREKLAFVLVSGCITQTASEHILADERLGDLLVELGNCTREKLASAFAKVNSDLNRPLGELLVREGAVSNRQIIEALELQVQRRVLRACAMPDAKFDFVEGNLLPNDGRVQVAPSAMLRGK